MQFLSCLHQLNSSHSQSEIIFTNDEHTILRGLSFIFALFDLFIIIIIIIIIIIKRGWQCKAGRERLTPYQSEDPTTPTHRNKEKKGKTVGDKKGASS